MKILKFVTLLSCFGCTVLSISSSALAETKDKSLKVGALLSLTGDYAIYGTELQRGMQIALKNPAADCPIELEFQDIATMSGNGAVTAAQHLTAVDKVDAALVMGMDETLQIAPIFTRTKTPLVVMWDSNDSVRRSGPYVFSTGFSTEGTGRVIAKFALEKLRVKRVAIVANTNPWSTIVSPAFKKALLLGGGEVAYETTTEIEDRDFRTIATRIKALEVEAVFFPFALPSTAAEFVKQMRSIGYKGHLLSPETFSGDAIPLAGSAAEDVYMTWIYTDSVPAIVEPYEKEFGKPSSQPEIVAMGADAMWAVQKACKNSRETNSSLTIAMIKMFGDERALARTMRIFKVQSGKVVEAD